MVSGHVPAATRNQEKGIETMAITIHPDLQTLIPALTTEEFHQLEANLLAEGCRDPLVVWHEEQVLVDGHNRLQICAQHGLDYRLHEVSLPDLDAAKAWMVSNQLGRRNLTPEQTSYFRGKQYELQKQMGFKGNQHKSAAGKSYQKQDTAQVLARQHHVAEKTIRNDAAFAKAVDTIADAVGPDARQAILARDAKVTQKDVTRLATLAKQNPQTATHVLKAVQEVKTPKQAKQIVQEAVKEGQHFAALLKDERLADAGELPPTWDEVYDANLARLLTAALRSLDALRSHLLVNKEDWLAVHLPAALERQTVACLKLEEQWWLVESLFSRSETLCRLSLDADPYITACAIVDRMGCEYAHALAVELQKLVTAAREAPAPEAETPCPLPAGTKQCGKGHAPYPESKRECPACIRLRTQEYRKRLAERKETHDDRV
jgi:hypothetical protein